MSFVITIVHSVLTAACVGSDDPAVGEQQQDERIEVHGCRPGYRGTGGPGAKPDRKQCGARMGEQGCFDCSMYNHIHVDG